MSALLEGIAGRSWTSLAELYAEDAVVEHPFNVPEPSTVNGRAELRERFASAPMRPFTLELLNPVVRETDDPEVVVAEYDYKVTVPGSGRSFVVANVLVVRVRGGLIVHSRDYHNHAALHAAASEAAA
ncbi:nuclear transport factor 2 family protein [Actinocrispum sp. NPDC049592]|uniref:nuclear transport factor 2 family protein n=1 Tax=Actinocrispum sp. NPDC049592 TaxID=3154835 RepID=UPI0034469569